MESLLLKLVNLSITASWLVLAVLLIRLVFRKAPKWVSCFLWGLVALRLICPISIESTLGLIPVPSRCHRIFFIREHPSFIVV